MNNQSVLSQTFTTIKRNPKPILVFAVVSGIAQILYKKLISFFSHSIESLNNIDQTLAVIWCFVLNVLPYLLFALVMTCLYLFTLNSIFSKESPKNALFFDELLGYDRKKAGILFLMHIFAQTSTGVNKFVQDGVSLLGDATEWGNILEYSSIFVSLFYLPTVAIVAYYFFPRKTAEYITSRSRKSTQAIKARTMLFPYLAYLCDILILSGAALLLDYAYLPLLSPFLSLPYLFLILSFYRAFLPLPNGN